jgi:hypothetical protein
MFYLNSDDMEGLFREAAEKYQLNTDAATDWDKIESTLHGTGTDAFENAQPEEKKKRRFVFWWFLLLPLGWFSHYAWNNAFQKSNVQKDTAAQSVLVNTPQQDGNISKKDENSLLKIEEKKTAAVKENRQKNVSAKAVLFPVNNLSAASRSIDKPPVLIDKAEKNDAATIMLAESNAEKNDMITGEENTPGNITPFTSGNVFIDQPAQLINDTLKNENRELNPKEVPSEAVVKKGDSSVQQPVVQRKKISGFYAGLFVAPDLTFIKSQRTNGVGSTFGFTGGYQLNKHWSIETGVSFDKKKYYTAGQYFDKSSISYFDTINILSVKGYCNMIDVPINIRYNFGLGNRKTRWTASLGASSYFMHKEYYDYYFVLRNGDYKERGKDYYPSSKNFFAIINIGAGIQQKIGKTTALQIEPYFKIPLSGVGTGKLSFSSTGVNLGIIKHFH